MEKIVIGLLILLVIFMIFYVQYNSNNSIETFETTYTPKNKCYLTKCLSFQGGNMTMDQMNKKINDQCDSAVSEGTISKPYDVKKNWGTIEKQKWDNWKKTWNDYKCDGDITNFYGGDLPEDCGYEKNFFNPKERALCYSKITTTPKPELEDKKKSGYKYVTNVTKEKANDSIYDTQCVLIEDKNYACKDINNRTTLKSDLSVKTKEVLVKYLENKNCPKGDLPMVNFSNVFDHKVSICSPKNTTPAPTNPPFDPGIVTTPAPPKPPPKPYVFGTSKLRLQKCLEDDKFNFDGNSEPLRKFVERNNIAIANEPGCYKKLGDLNRYNCDIKGGKGFINVPFFKIPKIVMGMPENDAIYMVCKDKYKDQTAVLLRQKCEHTI